MKFSTFHILTLLCAFVLLRERAGEKLRCKVGPIDPLGHTRQSHRPLFALARLTLNFSLLFIVSVEIALENG